MSRNPRWYVAASIILAFAASAWGYYWLRHRNRGPAEGSAADHWLHAQSALSEGDAARARSHLERCLEVWPFHAETHFLLARCYRRLDDAHNWQNHLKYAELFRWPAKETGFENQLMNAQAGDVAGADRVLIGQFQSRPEAEALILEALLKGYLETHQWRELFQWADHWTQSRPGDWQPHYFRGRGYQLLWLPDRAARAYRQVVEIKFDYLPAHLHLAEVLMVDGHYEEAVREFELYRQTYPDHAGALVGLAHCLFSQTDLDGTAEMLDRLLARNPRHPGGLFLQAKLSLNRGDAKAALDWLRRAEEVTPKEIDVINLFATTLRQMGRKEEAEKYEGKLADLRGRLKEFEEARKQVGDEPNNPAHRHRAGVLALQLARDEDAARWFKSVLRIDPHFRPTHETLAEYYEQGGNSGRADYHRRMAANSPAPGPSGEDGKSR